MAYWTKCQRLDGNNATCKASGFVPYWFMVAVRIWNKFSRHTFLSEYLPQDRQALFVPYVVLICTVLPNPHQCRIRGSSSPVFVMILARLFPLPIWLLRIFFLTVPPEPIPILCDRELALSFALRFADFIYNCANYVVNCLAFIWCA